MMEHYETILVLLSIFAGAGVLALIWLTVKIVGWIVKARDRRKGK